MTAQIRVKVIPRFPADVVAGAGITVVRAGRTYTFSINQASMFAGLPVVTAPTVGDKIPLDGATLREITVENLRLSQGVGVLASDYGAIPDVSTTGVPAANTAAILAAFAASPYVNLGGRTFYVTSIAIPVAAKRLFNGTLIAGGTYGASTAVVSVSANMAGFTLDNVTVSVNVGTYTTTNGVALIGGTDSATVSNCSLSGIFPAFIGRATNIRIIGNTFASGTFGRAIFATSDSGAASIFTVTSASPGVFTKTAHGLLVNDTVILYTTGALYTGLTAGRLAYIKTVPTVDTFTASLTLGGTAINTSGTQSGTHYYTSNGAVGLIVSGNTIYKSSSVNSQGIIVLGSSGALLSNNIIIGMTNWPVASLLGANNAITNNIAWYPGKEAFHTDSGVGASIKGNQAIFDSTSSDVGISVSSDNGPPAVDTLVEGNTIDSPFGTGIYLVGATGCSVQSNKIRNANVGNTALSASIILDGTLTTKNTIGQNTIEDNLGFNAYQVGESNYTSGAPSGNYIAQQIGKIGATGYILNVATTDTAIRAGSSPASSDTVGGVWFGASAFAKRDTAALSVYLYDYDNNLSGSLGGAGTPLANWGQTTHRWSSRGYGSVYASLGAASWNWTAVAAPGTPAAGTANVYVDSTTKRLCNKDDAGNVYTTVDNLAWTAYTPTVTSGSGTFTTVSATGFYKQIGKTVIVRIEVNITTNGTAAGKVKATLPINVAAGTISQALAGFNSGSGASLSAGISPADSVTWASIFTSTGGYPGANATVLDVQGVYEVP